MPVMGAAAEVAVLVLLALLVVWIVVVPVRDKAARSDYQTQQHRIRSVRTPNPVLRQRLWRQMPKLDDGRGICPGCLRGKHFEDFHLDHIVPKTKGGADADHNIQLLCHSCNLTKGSGTMGDLDVRLARRGLRPSRERRREVAAMGGVKSQATAAWERRNWVKVTLVRCGAGSTPCCLRILHTVEAPTR